MCSEEQKQIKVRETVELRNCCFISGDQGRPPMRWYFKPSSERSEQSSQAGIWERSIPGRGNSSRRKSPEVWVWLVMSEAHHVLEWSSRERAVGDKSREVMGPRSRWALGTGRTFGVHSKGGGSRWRVENRSDVFWLRFARLTRCCGRTDWRVGKGGPWPKQGEQMWKRLQWSVVQEMKTAAQTWVVVGGWPGSNAFWTYFEGRVILILLVEMFDWSVVNL